MEIKTHNESETRRLGAAIGKNLSRPATLLLTGELGAGKTVLAKGIFEALGVPEDLVRSPSFSLINEYPTLEGTVFHVDLYRMEKAADLETLPLRDILNSESVVVIEWAERLPFQIPGATRVLIEGVGSSRTIRIEPEIPELESA